MHSAPLRSPGRLTAFWAVALAIQAPFLGGSTLEWTQALSIFLVGLAVLLQPPVRSLGKWPLLALCLLFGWSLLPLLPAAWLTPHLSAWRLQLADYAPDLPGAVSPQPWLTAEGCLVLAAGLLAFQWFATLDFSREVRAQALRYFSSSLILFAATCLLLHWRHYQPLTWYNERGFGPFPSRNHTGDLLGVGGVVVAVCALNGLRRREAAGWWHLAGLLAVVAALFLNYSRGGVAALFAGLLIYSGWLLVRGKSPAATALSVAGLIAVAIVAMLFAGAFSERLASTSGEKGGVLGFRSQVYEDTVRMAVQGPWTGLGFGNFEAVFPYFRQATPGPARLLHPESDWLWAAVELGPAGLALALLAAGSLLPGLGRVVRARSRPLECGAVAAVAGFVLHGLIDVPARLLGTALPALLLLGLAFGADALAPASRWSRWVYRLAGLGLLAAGAYLFWAARIATDPQWGHPGAELATALARREIKAGHYARGLDLAGAGLRSAPLSWRLRSQRAVALLGEHRFEEAAASFKAAKLLQPGRADLPALEAEHWLRYVPALALPAWKEAVALDPAHAAVRFDRMWSLTVQQPQLRTKLSAWAQTRPDLFAAWTRYAEVEQFRPALAAWREHDARLEEFSPDDLRTVLNRWWQLDRESLRPLLLTIPSWLEQAWPLLARQLATEKAFEEAYRLALAHAPAPIWPDLHSTSTIEELRHRLAHDAGDYASAYALARLAQTGGDLATAAFVLGRTSERAGAPSYFWYLRAEVAAQRNDWPGAWRALATYLHLT